MQIISYYERMIGMKVNHLEKEPYKVKILVLASDKGGHFVPFVEEQIALLQTRGVDVARYGVTGRGLIGYLCELPALCRTIRAEQPDIVHAHYGLSGLLANLQRRVPVVTTYHGSDINKTSILRFSKIAMRLSAYNIFVSKRNIAIAIRRKGEKAKRRLGKYSLLPCGVNLTDDQLTSRAEARKALGMVDDAKIVLFAGAFNNAVKDPALAQEAIDQCAKFTNGLRVFNDLKDLNDSALTLIELRGYTRAQVNQLMCAANCLLMTSKTEGSPQVIKEAMACGCPIVSVDVGDVAERVSGVEGCYVVPTRDPKDIAEALMKALAFEGKTNGRQRIIEMGLSNEQVAKRLIAVYQSLV